MTWRKRGKDLWSDPTGRFDKVLVDRVVTNLVRDHALGGDKSAHPETVRVTYWVAFDWDLGQCARFSGEEEVDGWVELQKQKPPGGLALPGRPG